MTNDNNTSTEISSVGEATTVDWPDWPIYLGHYTDYTQDDSTDPSVYTWSLVKGNDGAPGPQGPTGATGTKGDKGDTGFFIGTTPPPNPTVGTVWATNDASGNMVSAKTWNGSAWVSTAFTQDLVAGNITASKIVGGELDVNKITIKNAQNIPIEGTVSLGDKFSSMKEDADGLKLTVTGGGNLLNNTTNTLQSVSVNGWMFYTASADEPVAKHQLDGQKVTLSAWIENPSKDAWVQMWTNTSGIVQGNKIPAGESGWSQVTFTMPSGFTDWNIVIGSGNNVDTAFSYSSLQLEVGPNRTAWSQSTADISALEVTANGLDYYVNKSQGSNVLKALLKVDPNNSVIAQIVNGNPVAAINLSKEGKVQIDGSHISLNGQTTIPDATIKSAMIDSLSADKLTAGTIDASQIRVINLDANSITTGSFSARIDQKIQYSTYNVSASSPWNFDDTKLFYANWFLIGEISADHVWNGPKDMYGNRLTPYMYVTSRGSSAPDGDRFTVTVWKDNDPTQYQRIWAHGSWSEWVMLPNSQNIVSAINLSPDGVKISGKNIELDGNTRVVGGFNLVPPDSTSQDQAEQKTYRPFKWNNGSITMQNGVIQTTATNVSAEFPIFQGSFNNKYVIGTVAPMYIKYTLWDGPSMSNEYARTYIGAEQIETPMLAVTSEGINEFGSYHGLTPERGALYVGNFEFLGSKIKSTDNGSFYVTNSAGSNFDNSGSIGFQVWGGIGLGKSTIYTPTRDLYIQQGNVGPALGQSYSSAAKVDVHCNRVISQTANTVSSRLSVKTDITKVTYDRALAAVEGTEMYDYRYTNDETGQHYVSGIIDDINPEPQYHMDGMLINKERTARIDANLLGYHQVVIQKLLERVATLEAKLNNK